MTSPVRNKSSALEENVFGERGIDVQLGVEGAVWQEHGDECIVKNAEDFDGGVFGSLEKELKSGLDFLMNVELGDAKDMQGRK